MITVNNWKIKVPEDVEIDRRTHEMFPHSVYGERFLRQATAAERQELLRKHKGVWKHD